MNGCTVGNLSPPATFGGARDHRSVVAHSKLPQLERVRQRLAKKGLGLALSPAAKEFIGNQGYDPVYGARPLKRAIQKHLLDPLSLDVLEGRFHEGDVIEAEVEEGRIVFRTRT